MTEKPAEAGLDSQAFWNDFMRRPEAKEAYQADRRLQEKKARWLAEKCEIEDRGRRRELLAEALKEVPPETKKLIAPMFHIRVVQDFLWILFDESMKSPELSFHDRLRSDKTTSHLTRLRETFQQNGEEGMQSLENQWMSMCDQMAKDEEEKKDNKPVSIDVHTLKQVLEFAQECKREGNLKFKEGLYEEALLIYSQGDEVMRKWKVDDNLKNEQKWLKDYHLACLKNKAQAALKLELFQTALEASEAALALDSEDHKAWYRKVHALKGLGQLKEAEEALNKLQDIAQWCPERQQVLKDCETERKRIHIAAAKHKAGTQGMLNKAFQAGIFSGDRDKELEDAKQKELPRQESAPSKKIEPPRQLERNVRLTAALAGELIDELSEEYGQKWFQERVQKCARDSGFERTLFLRRLKDIAFEVQKPVLQKWGFEGSEHGVREMQAAIRDHVGRKEGESMPAWLKAKQDRCVELLYGGKEGGMLQSIIG